MLKYLQIILFSLLGGLFVACNSENPSGSGINIDIDAIADSAAAAGSVQESTLSREVMSEIMSSIPSPLEMAILIKHSNADFSPEILNQPNRVKNYEEEIAQAVNLGIFGADLGYTNLYGQNTTSISYLKAVKQLADKLRIGKFFNFNMLRDLAENKDNLDALINMSQSSFSDIDNYLKENDRSAVSSALLMGGWIEALYLASHVAHANSEAQALLLESIGEQKLVLEKLLMLANSFENDEFKDLQEGFEDLNKAYANVSISYETIEVEGDGGIIFDEDGLPMVSAPQERSIVAIVPEDLDKIEESIKKLRTKLTK